MSRVSSAFKLAFGASLIYAFSILVAVAAIFVSAVVAGFFVNIALGVLSAASSGAIPSFGYFQSVAISFILIFCSYIGARGAAQRAD